MEEQWITDRLPTKADGDRDGVVRMRHRVGFALVHWSHIGSGAPWQHTSYWKPSAEPETTEPDRIAALEQQLKEHIRAQSVLAAALVKRLKALEGFSPDGAIPEGGRGVPGGIAALEQRVAERFATLEQLFWDHNHKALEPIEVPAPMRQFVVQIAAAGSELYALCDDDTIWILSHPSWIQLPAIPQPEA